LSKILKGFFLFVISSNIFALNSFQTEWSEPTKITSIAGYTAGSTDALSISFSDGTLLNPKNCGNTDFYTLTTDATNGVGKSILSIALTSGTANLFVQYKVHSSSCGSSNRPIITELKINFR